MTLWDLSKNASARVSGYTPVLHNSIKARLEEMGFSIGAHIVCTKRSPFNGPLVISVQDCVYSLERSLAESIEVKL